VTAFVPFFLRVYMYANNVGHSYNYIQLYEVLSDILVTFCDEICLVLHLWMVYIFFLIIKKMLFSIRRVFECILFSNSSHGHKVNFDVFFLLS